MAGRHLQMGVIGLGRGFMLTLPALRAHPAIKLVAAADPRPEARTRFEAEFGRAYARAEDLVTDPEVDVVYVASPHEHHVEHAIAAARAGKHVLVEKPMALRLKDCAAMARAAREAGIVMVVGPSHGFDEPVHLATQEIASGAHGQPRMITAVNYTDFLYRPRRPEELIRDRGGGVVFSQAAHQIDVVRQLAASSVASVRAVTGDWDPDRPTDGAYAAFLTFANGAAASLTYSGYGRFDSDALVDWISETGYPKDPDAYGDARRALAGQTSDEESRAKQSRAYGSGGVSALRPAAPFHEHFGFILVSCERADLRPTATGLWVYGERERRFVALPSPVIPRAAVIDELVAAVLDGVPAVHDAAWGSATMACCLALIESSVVGREVAPTMLPTLDRDANV